MAHAGSDSRDAYYNNTKIFLLLVAEVHKCFLNEIKLLGMPRPINGLSLEVIK